MGRSIRPTKIVLLLSSGATPRYRDDILRSLAIPTGAHLQFRYDKTRVSTTLFEKLRENTIRGYHAMVGYFDTSTHAIEIIPLRFARIHESIVEGDFSIIRFEVRGYAATKKGEESLTNINHLTDGLLPFRSADDEISGHSCHLLTSTPPGWQNNCNLEVWQKIVTNLASRHDFQDCSFFYSVRGIYQLPKVRAKMPSNGVYTLKANRGLTASSSPYRLDIIHWAKEVPSQDNWILSKVAGNGIQSLTAERLEIDSRYDIKSIYFRVLHNSLKQHAVFLLGRVDKKETHDFEMTITIPANYVRNAIVVLAVGLSLSVPRFLDTFNLVDWQTALAHFVGAIFAAFLVTLGIRKP